MRIRAAVVRQLTDHARRGHPNEVAGLLGAGVDGVITAAVELTDGTPDSVQVDAADAAAAAEALERDGLTRAGSYHSHTSRPAYPTEADRLAMTTGEPMLIVCSRTLEVRAFELAENRLQIRELELEME